MPTVFVTQNEDLTTSKLFDGGDEVNDLNILRLMAKRSYIISCYESVVESKNYSNTGKFFSEALLFAKHGENMFCTEIILNVENNFCTQHVLPMFCQKKSF